MRLSPYYKMLQALYIVPLLVSVLSKAAGTGNSNPNLHTLSVEMIFEIGSYLKSPYKDLSVVCKSITNVYTVERPYYSEIARIFDIPELLTVRKSVDLGFFHKLNFVPDKLTKFHLLHNHLFYHENTFNANAKAIAWHIYKIYKDVPEEYKKSKNRVKMFNDFMKNLVNLLIKHEAYDKLVNIFEEDQEEFVKGKGGFVKFIHVKAFLDELIRSPRSSELITRLFQISDSNNIFTFIMTLLIYFPFDIYKNSFKGHENLFERSLKGVLLKSIPILDGSVTDIFDRVNILLNEFIPDESVLILRLMNAIRFGPEFGDQSDIDFDRKIIFWIFSVASIVKKQNLFHQFIMRNKSLLLKQIKTKKKLASIKTICDILNYLTPEESYEFLSHDNNVFVLNLISGMTVSRIRTTEQDINKYKVTLKATEKARIHENGSPEDITIITNCSEWTLLEHCTVADDETLEAFLEDLARLPNHMALLQIRRRCFNGRN